VFAQQAHALARRCSVPSVAAIVEHAATRIEADRNAAPAA
jgi:hypothetical protein